MRHPRCSQSGSEWDTPQDSACFINCCSKYSDIMIYWLPFPWAKYHPIPPMLNIPIIWHGPKYMVWSSTSTILGGLQLQPRGARCSFFELETSHGIPWCFSGQLNVNVNLVDGWKVEHVKIQLKKHSSNSNVDDWKVNHKAQLESSRVL